MEDLAKAGDAGATRIRETAIAAAAIGITSLVMAFSPHVVVPGGGPGRRLGFSGPLTVKVKSSPAARLPPVTLALAALGDDAGLIGAARWDASLACAGQPA
jgi:predicted NBD/HSP70 family sugar kinase